MSSANADAPSGAQQRPEEAAQRPICTFFAMGGCCKGARCPFSHELVQVAPRGVDVSGGYFISGKVANYKATASSSTRSLGCRWDDPAASSSTDGLSTLASPSSCCMTTGTSLSADAKEWAVTDSAATSSTNSATSSITFVQSHQGATSRSTRASAGLDHCGPTAVPCTAPPMPHSQRGSQPRAQPPSPHLLAQQLQKSPHQSQPQQGHITQYQQPPQPRSAANAVSAVFPNRSESVAAAEARHTSPAPSHPAAAPRTVSFMQSPSDSGATTIVALASLVNRQRSATGHPSATPSSGALQPSKVIFACRPDDHASAPTPALAAAAPPRYTALSTSTAAATKSITPSIPTTTISVAVAPAPAHGRSRAATPSQHVEAFQRRSREALATAAEHNTSIAGKPHVGQGAPAPAGAAASPPQYEARTASSAQTRVIPPAPRSQQQQAQQRRAQQEAQHQAQAQVQQQQQQQTEQEAQPQRVHPQIQPQKQEQQQTVYVLTTLPSASSTSPHEGIVTPAQLSFGYTLPYALPAPTATAPAPSPVLISEQPNATRPTYTLLSSCPPQPRLPNFQLAKGTVSHTTPGQALPQTAALSDGEAPRLILVRADGAFTLLQAATFAATAGPGL
ncbi:hypothetical protein LSCM1_03963 [Leishmania martiniquensis]|uniref:C3H1-type domain-containing protein n=1 Tax=Leishmania martiniquensis TaxID=1580590 RepID=A0A836GFD3_9TRYP|nr:hypothetical protein LSCM1_03963 [Leishmania martiniquensis]